MIKSLLLLSLIYLLVTNSSIAKASPTPINVKNLNPIPFQLIKLKKAKKVFKKRKTVKVAIIDTGIDLNHSFFKNSLSKKKKYSKNVLPQSIDLTHGQSSLSGDLNGHGTHVSGIIKSINPDVQIISIKFNNPKGKGKDNFNSLLKSYKLAIKMKVDIINYSGGGLKPYFKEFNLLKKAEKSNILLIAASGNQALNLDHKKNVYFPASYKLNNIISVAAHDNNSKILPFSNFGKNSVHLMAPGFKIIGPMPGNKFGEMTGTSQATAFVTGVASLLISHFPNLRPSQIKEILINSSLKRGPTTIAHKHVMGGQLDAFNAFKSASRLTFKKSREN